MARDPGIPIISISFLIGIASIVACLLFVFITMGALVNQTTMNMKLGIILGSDLGFMRLRPYGVVMQNTR